MQTTSRSYRHLIAAASIGAALSMGAVLSMGAAKAQTATPQALTQVSAQTTAVAAANQPLTIANIYERMVAEGYRDIREIKLDHGQYKVKAHNAQGERVKLYVNTNTGVVERERVHH
ncbi:PepSY domain-containing protein [Castellaniella sp.]|uniref:PepSY domain-containing protein n=1 Tax=Castellaniella sp. TaxID=1955812 RepID=UPI00356070F4